MEGGTSPEEAFPFPGLCPFPRFLKGMYMSVLLGVCNWVHPLLQSPSCCKALKETGIDALQLALGPAGEGFPLSSPDVRRQWKEEAGLYGIRLSAVAVLDVLEHGMTAEPGSGRRAAAEKAIAAAVDCAADMGIPQIVLPSFKASAIRSKDDLRETARCLRLACALAKHRGVAVATENLLDATARKSLLNIVGYDNLCSCLDLSHFVLRGREDVFEALPELLAACCGVHLKDGMYGEPGVRPLGEGSCRVGELLAALKREGYDGTLFLENRYAEPVFGPDPLYALRRDAEYVRQAFL